MVAKKWTEVTVMWKSNSSEKAASASISVELEFSRNLAERRKKLSTG